MSALGEPKAPSVRSVSMQLPKVPEHYDVHINDHEALPCVRTAHISSGKEIRLPELAERLARAPSRGKEGDIIDDSVEIGFQRLETFRHVIKALEQKRGLLSVKSNIIKSAGDFLRNSALSIMSYAVVSGRSCTSRLSDKQQKAAKENAALLKELSEKTGGRDLIHLRTFQVVMNVKGEQYAERLFNALDKKATGTITTEQLLDTLLALKNGTVEEKIAFMWSYISSEKQCITRDELKLLLKACCSDSELSVNDAPLEKLASAFFAKAGKAEKDTLQLQDFIQVLRSRPEIMDSIETGGFHLKANRQENMTAMKALPFIERMYMDFLQRLQVDSIQLTAWMTLIILAEIAGFVIGFLQNDSGPAFNVYGYSYSVAKGAARSIQVSVIILPFSVARNLLTVLRSTPLQYVLPLDEHLDVHRQLGYHFFFWSWIHTIAHIFNGARGADHSRHHQAPPLQAIPCQTQAQFYAMEVSITGVVLMGILCLGYLFAVPWVRKSWLAAKLRAAKLLNNFEAFYISHALMALAVLVLLIVHPMPGPAIHPVRDRSTTWAYLLGGAVLYMLERIARIARQAAYNTAVIGVTLHEDVLELCLQKPKSRHGWWFFNARAGQYCFLCVPSLSHYEWHPFSLTSGPNDDFISFHIRSAGDWTKALYKRCEVLLAEAKSSDHRSNCLDTSDTDVEAQEKRDTSMLSKRLVVRVDGPFGAPAQDHSQFNCILLVGAGIGITPFASVLRQLVNEYNLSISKDCGKANKTVFKPKKVYFVWTTPQQSAPRYFRSTLEDIKATDHNHFLDIRIYITSAAAHNDLRVSIAKVAQMIQHEEDGYDAYAGTFQSAPCFFGRPDWHSTFSRIRDENVGSKVGVFVCGPPVFANVIKSNCKIFNDASTAGRDKKAKRTKFIFHKENF